MANPRVPLGILNRIKATIVWASLPNLNITPSFLGEPGIRMAFEGVATTMIDAMTGRVISGEPYQGITVQIPLLKTQNLSNLYEQQRLKNTRIGDGTVYPDVVGNGVLGTYFIENCAIINVGELDFGGRNPIFGVSIGGTYLINNNLWD